MIARPWAADTGSRSGRSGSRRLGLALGLATTLGALGALAAEGPPSHGDVFDIAHTAVRTFTDRHGLPQNTIHAIARDSRGYLWVGTQDGAARFNGRDWTVVDMPDRDVSNYVRTLVAARDCTLWFGREDGGVVRLRPEPFAATPRPEAFTVFGTAQGLPALRVNNLLEARDGTIWAATAGGGAARLVGEGFEPLSEGLKDARLWVIAEIEDDQGRPQIVAGGEGGLAVLEGSRWSPLDLGPPELVGSVNSVVQTKDATGARTLWVGSYGNGLLRVRGTRIDRLGPREGLTSRLVTTLAVSRRPTGEEQVWVGTRDGGLFRYSEERFATVPLGASISEIYSVHAGGNEDAGALWVGTRAAGLLELESASWVALDRSSGLPADQVLGLLETKDAQGRPVHWVGTNRGLAVIRGARLAVEGHAQGLPGPQVLAFAELRERGRPPEIWASVVGLGLVRRVGSRWVRVDARPAFNADHGVWLLASMSPGGEGVLWVGTERSGLARMERGAWTVLTARDGLPSDHVASLLETESGGRRSLWVGTRGGGVAQVVGRRVAGVWNRSSGLPNDDAMSLAEVRLPGGRREVWAGTRAGVARRAVASGSWSRLSDEPRWPSETVLSIGQDRAGRVYLGTQRGVVRLTPRPPGAPEIDEFETEIFGLADGLPSATANWAQLRDSQGRIWIATTGGVALFDPSREPSREAPPAPLLIETATAGRRAITSGAVLGPSERDVAFDFALLTPRRGSAVRYRAQLVGYDTAPSEWVAGHQKTYTNLPAGRYVFRVEAREGAGALSGPVEISFAVAPYPWLRPWALALEALALLGLGVLFVRARERALRRRAAGLETLVADRTRQLSEANRQLAELSSTDPLTGLANRRTLEAHVDGEWKRLARSGGDLAFVMLDVDHFKEYNDTLGHPAGDECLRRLAEALRPLAQRPGDLVARYGGEEFACLLLGLDRDQARTHAERLRAAIEGLALPHPGSGVSPFLTVSLGVAWARPVPSGEWRDALAAADAALYRAKQGGRNRVEMAP